MNFMRGGKEKSNLNQASTSLRDHEGAMLFHLPWRGRRFDGDEEERGVRRKREGRESCFPNLEREKDKNNENILPKNT